MATPKKKEETPKDKLRKRMKKQIEATNEKASIFSGEKEKIGKFKTQKAGTQVKDGGLDKFFKNVEEGFRNIKAVAEHDPKPYDGILGRVEVERLTKTVEETNKKTVGNVAQPKPINK